MAKRYDSKLYRPIEGWLFIAPALIGTLIFVILPILASFILSFFEWDLLTPAKFVGFSNYETILAEPSYLKILVNTFYYAFCVTVFGVTLPLILAYLVSRKFLGSGMFKLISMLPYITPMVVAGTVWAWVFDPTSGLINNLLHTNLKWLYDTNLAMPVLIFVSIWKLLGYNMVLFLTGFANINTSLIEAAEVDGANNLHILSKIIIPLLAPMIGFVTVVTIISSFQVFDLVYMMTQGGPDGATDVIVYSVYKLGFEYFETGKSCALGYILFLAVFLLSSVLALLKRER